MNFLVRTDARTEKRCVFHDSLGRYDYEKLRKKFLMCARSLLRLSSVRRTYTSTLLLRGRRRACSRVIAERCACARERASARTNVERMKGREHMVCLGLETVNERLTGLLRSVSSSAKKVKKFCCCWFCALSIVRKSESKNQVSSSAMIGKDSIRGEFLFSEHRSFVCLCFDGFLFPCH